MPNKNCFLFHFENSFPSWDDQILIFYIQTSWSPQMPNHETQNILLNNLGSKQSGNEIWSDYVIPQNEIFYQKSLLKMWHGN